MLLAACEETDEGSEEVSEDQTEQVEVGLETIVEHLESPWSIDRHNDTFYLTERTGSIVKADAEGDERQEVELSDELSNASEAGLLGFVLSQDFEDSNEAYAYYTYEHEDGQFNRVVRLILSDDIWSEDGNITG